MQSVVVLLPYLQGYLNNLLDPAHLNLPDQPLHRIRVLESQQPKMVSYIFL